MNKSIEKIICRSQDMFEGEDSFVKEDFLENKTYGGFRVWEILFFSFGGLIGFVIILCCCVRFRIPRTKQEIEAEYMRKELTRKFNKHLRAIEKRNGSILSESDFKTVIQFEEELQGEKDASIR